MAQRFSGCRVTSEGQICCDESVSYKAFEDDQFQLQFIKIVFLSVVLKNKLSQTITIFKRLVVRTISQLKLLALVGQVASDGQVCCEGLVSSKTFEDDHQKKWIIGWSGRSIEETTVAAY